jgi:hypothetical protein
VIASGAQPEQSHESIGGLAKFAIGVGAVGASGFIPVGNNRRMWDHYLGGIRAIETGFPAAILRTFRTSETLSPLETWSQINLGQRLIHSQSVYSQYLQRTLGEEVLSATISRGGAGIFGDVRDETGKVIGIAARIASGTQRGESIADYYARLKGVTLEGTQEFSLREGALRARYFAEDIKIPYEKWVEGLPYAERQPNIPLISRFQEEIDIFGKKVKVGPKMQRAMAEADILSTLARARAATTVGRLNTLLTKPFDIPVVGDILHRIPFIQSLAIKPGPHTSMTSAYIRKGLIAGAVGTGLFYYDYLRSQGGPAPIAAGTLGGAAIGAFVANRSMRPFSTKGGIVGGSLGLFTAISPRFDKGLFHGAMSLVTDLNLFRSKLSTSVGLQESLRRQEEITPGLLSLKTAIGFTAGGGLLGGLAGYGKMMYEAAKIKKATGQPLEEIFETLRHTWYGEKGKVGTFGRWLQEGIGKKLFKAPIIGKHLSKIRTPMGAGAVAGAAAWLAASTVLPILSGNFAAAIPGLNLLGTEETPEELQAIYSGEKEVPVRKGRWWEFGRSTAYEGGPIEYYRPHALARLASRAYQKGLWGSEEERWEHEPLLHPFKALFGSDEWKYHYEQKYQYERPAPLTSTYGEEIPFIGPVIAATFGKLLKPRKYVRPEEWMQGEDEYLYRPGRPDEEPVYELGGLKPGAPVSPDEASQVFNEMLYKRREAIGLVGFASGAMESALTGREEIFPNKMTMATMGGETGSEYWLWKHLNLGGGVLTTEPIRRFIPHSRSYLETYNPLRNELPSWMPDDYFLDLKYGNPFEKIPEAEIRLPGPGYAALHPELEGMSPEDYPLTHRLKILGDVAMWSPEYQKTLGMARRNRGQMSEAEARMIDTIEEQVRQKKKRREFSEYRFRDEELADMQLTVRDILGPREVLTEELGSMKVELQGVGAARDMEAAMEAARDKLYGKKITVAVPALEARRYDMVTAGPRMKAVAMVDNRDYGRWMAEQGLTEQAPLQDEFEQLRYDIGDRVAGSMWESMTRATETPVELLTPLSPSAKFIRKRSAIEEYIQTEAVGTGSAFWDRPLSNFLGPAEEMGEYKLGDSEPAPVVQQRRAIQEYFDMLEWQKANEAMKAAEADGDWSEAIRERHHKALTMFGMDPYAANPTQTMRAMPRRSRDFFQAFSDAKVEQDRQQIMGLTSQQEQRVYLAQWMQQQAMAIKAKQAARIDTREDAMMLNQILMARRSDGYEYDDAIEAQWKNETGGQVPFEEWLREKRAKQYFRTRALPGPDWIGWHPAVDLEDVKAKYLRNEGMDHHDFDVWGDRMRSLSRKPYLTDEAISQLTSSEQLREEMAYNSAAMARNAKNLRRSMNGSEPNITTMTIGSPGLSGYNINIQDERESLVSATMRQLGTQ